MCLEETQNTPVINALMPNFWSSIYNAEYKVANNDLCWISGSMSQNAESISFFMFSDQDTSTFIKIYALKQKYSQFFQFGVNSKSFNLTMHVATPCHLNSNKYWAGYTRPRQTGEKNELKKIKFQTFLKTIYLCPQFQSYF